MSETLLKALQVGGVALVLAASGPALAQQDCDRFDPEPFGKVAPSSSDTPVPTNTWLWYTIGNAGDLDSEIIEPELGLLSLDSGQTVGLSEQGRLVAEDSILFAFQPDEDLDPLTDYEVEFPVDVEAGVSGLSGDMLGRVSFRTAEAADLLVPAVPVELGRELYTDYNQLGYGCDILDYQDEASFFVDSAGYFNLLGRSSDGSPLEDGLFTEVAAVSETAELEIFGTIGPNASMDVRFGAVDLAGNFSGWSELTEDVMPAPGCVSNGSSVSQGMLLPGGLLLLLAGRRSRRRALRAEFPPQRFLVPLLALAVSAGLFLGPSPVQAEEPEEPSAEESAAAAQEAVEAGAPDWAQPRDWRKRSGEQLGHHVKGWGAVALGSGAVQVGSLLFQVGRAPHALQLSLVNNAVWLPSLATLLTFAVSRAAILSAGSDLKRAALATRRQFKGAAAVLGITGGVLWHVAIGFALVGGSYDPSLIHTAFAVPLSLTMSALACEVAAATVQWSITEGRYAGRRAAPRVRLLSAGPTGVVLAF